MTLDAQILEELRAIRALLEQQAQPAPKPPKVPKRAPRAMTLEEIRAYADKKLRAAGAIKK